MRPCNLTNSKILFLLSANAIAAGSSATQVATPCGKVSFIDPPITVVRETKPRIAWRPVAQATGYVLWIESRVPEGRVLFTQEVRTSEPQWIPPIALTDNSATVQVRVTPLCSQEQKFPSASHVDERTVVHRFRIEPPVTCNIASDPSIDWQGETFTLQWPGSAAASQYEVTIRSAIDGRLHAVKQSAFPQVSLTAPPTGIWIASVRPRCGKSPGPSRHLPLSVP